MLETLFHIFAWILINVELSSSNITLMWTAILMSYAFTFRLDDIKSEMIVIKEKVFNKSEVSTVYSLFRLLFLQWNRERVRQRKKETRKQILYNHNYSFGVALSIGYML